MKKLFLRDPDRLENLWRLQHHKHHVVDGVDRVSGWIHKAISLRRANGGGFESAKALLLEAAKLFPADSTIQYNLACYSAQLGQLDVAQEYLDKSYELVDAKQLKLMALDDEDLKPLWEGEAK